MDYIEFIGRDSFGEFAAYFRALAIDSVFLVTGGQSYTVSGARERMEALLGAKQVTRFDAFKVNPQLREIVGGADLLRSRPADVVLAVGGGSVLDVAKCVSLLSRRDSDAEGLVTGRLPVETPAAPVVAVPTTAGTGSEATRFATVYIGKTKHSLEHGSILPVISVVDPDFTMSLPPYQTAVAGIDALAQAIESYWSVRSTPETKDIAARAIELAVTALGTAVNRPDYESRLDMMVAANLAGKAINVTKTTACHALSYYLTAHFGVPHGHAVGLTLSRMLLYNSGVTDDDVNDGRGSPFVRDSMARLATVLRARDATDAAARIDHLMADVGLAGPVPGLNIDDDHIRNMVRDALNSNRMGNNPRKFTVESLTTFLESLFGRGS